MLTHAHTALLIRLRCYRHSEALDPRLQPLLSQTVEVEPAISMGEHTLLLEFAVAQTRKEVEEENSTIVVAAVAASRKSLTAT